MAFLATRPAAIITPGLEVFVQEVIAANTTEPFLMLWSAPTLLIETTCLAFSGVSPNPLKPTLAVRELVQSSLSFDRGTLSCGLLGPEIAGSTSSNSNSSTELNLIDSSLL